MSGKFSHALLLSCLIHVSLLGILLLGDFTPNHPKPKPTNIQVQPIKAVAVDKSKIEAQIKKLKKQEDDAARRVKRKKEQAAAAKRKRLKEEKAKRLRKKKAAEKKIADAKAKKAKAIADEKLRKKKAAEKKKADAEAKAKRLKEEKILKKKAEDKKRKDKEAKERAAQEQMLAEQMAEEMATRQKARQKQMMTEVGRYTALITRAIQTNLITDKATMENKSCKLTIKLAPSGFVINVLPGSGDAIVCDAASKAIYKAGKLPVSKDPEVFEKMRTISLTVVPEF